MKKRFSEEQIIGFLREAEAGMPIKDLCCKHGFSEASYYLWRSKFGGMSVPEATRSLRRAYRSRESRLYPKMPIAEYEHVTIMNRARGLLHYSNRRPNVNLHVAR